MSVLPIESACPYGNMLSASKFTVSVPPIDCVPLWQYVECTLCIQFLFIFFKLHDVRLSYFSGDCCSEVFWL